MEKSFQPVLTFTDFSLSLIKQTHEEFHTTLTIVPRIDEIMFYTDLKLIFRYIAGNSW
jgi:hypothetical protein